MSAPAEHEHEPRTPQTLDQATGSGHPGLAPDAAASIVLLVGAMLVRISLTDVYQRYVKAAMGPWLLLSGVLLALLGLVMVVRALRQDHDDEHHPHDPSAQQEPGSDHEHHHDHVGGDRVGWLLLAPVLALLLVAPPALGSYGVDRTAVRVNSTGGAVFATLPEAAAPRPISLLEVNERAYDRAGASFGTATLSLTGFVADGAEPGGFRLARYQIACCAADGLASVVHVSGVGDAPPARDQWTTVIGRYSGLAPDGLPIVTATSVQVIPAPVDPYE